nr:PREDICTED: perilipin-2-like isoform X2 [Paralichthys olivaceus]
MPMNNNQKTQNAAVRLSKLPLVHTACVTLSLLYADTKHNHPNLKAVCEVLENTVTVLCSVASERVSPVIVQLEPQISSANGVACKSLDWLETTFPVLHTPTEQIVATAKNRMHEIQEVMSIAANGTVDCVQHTVTWVMERMQQAGDGTTHTVVERAVSVASEGLDSALSVAEALVDQVLPPNEEDKKAAAAAAHSVRGFEAATLGRRFPVRLVSLTVKLCRRTCYVVGAKMHSVQVCCRGDVVLVISSGSGRSDVVADLGLEPPGAASVPAASGCVCAFLYLSDVQPKLPNTRSKPVRSNYK